MEFLVLLFYFISFYFVLNSEFFRVLLNFQRVILKIFYYTAPILLLQTVHYITVTRSKTQLNAATHNNRMNESIITKEKKTTKQRKKWERSDRHEIYTESAISAVCIMTQMFWFCCCPKLCWKSGLCRVNLFDSIALIPMSNCLKIFFSFFLRFLFVVQYKTNSSLTQLIFNFYFYIVLFINISLFVWWRSLCKRRHFQHMYPWAISSHMLTFDCLLKGNMSSFKTFSPIIKEFNKISIDIWLRWIFLGLHVIREAQKEQFLLTFVIFCIHRDKW